MHSADGNESSSNDSDGDIENRDPLVQPKRAPPVFNPITSFNSKEELDKYIDGHDCFYEHSKNRSKDGVTTYHYCSLVVARHATYCPVKLKVFESNTALSFGVSITTMIHDHTGLTLKKEIFPEAMKTEIHTLKTTFAMKPLLIFKQLQRTHTNVPIPKVPQIRRIINEQNAIKTPETVTYGQLFDWCESKSNPPDDIDEAFILGHFQDSRDDAFAIVVSTKRLLRNSIGWQNICSDGTYSIVWQGFPIIDVGFVDRANHYHLTALCLTGRERTAEYEFVFETIQNAAQKLMQSEPHPNVLISDAAPAIRNAFYNSFASAKQNVICSVHVQRNISKFKYRSKVNKDLIMKDFAILKGSASKSEFDKATHLFLTKWELLEPEFCTYFDSEWLDDETQNWYAGYTSFAPNHNNGQEGYHEHIKRDHTLRERLPVNTFKIKFMDMVSDMSARYAPDHPTGVVKKITHQPIVSNEMMQRAHSWYMDSGVFIGEKKRNKNTNTKRFTVPSSKYMNANDSGSITDLYSIENQEHNSFDDFVLNGMGMSYNVLLKCDKDKCFTESTCTCAFFFKKFICKHIIGLAFHSKLIDIPRQADSKTIGKKTTRGRPAKATGALVKQ